MQFNSNGSLSTIPGAISEDSSDAAKMSLGALAKNAMNYVTGVKLSDGYGILKNSQFATSNVGGYVFGAVEGAYEDGNISFVSGLSSNGQETDGLTKDGQILINSKWSGNAAMIGVILAHEGTHLALLQTASSKGFADIDSLDEETAAFDNEIKLYDEIRPSLGRNSIPEEDYYSNIYHNGTTITGTNQVISGSLGIRYAITGSYQGFVTNSNNPTVYKILKNYK